MFTARHRIEISVLAELGAHVSLDLMPVAPPHKRGVYMSGVREANKLREQHIARFKKRWRGRGRDDIQARADALAEMARLDADGKQLSLLSMAMISADRQASLYSRFCAHVPPSIIKNLQQLAASPPNQLFVNAVAADQAYYHGDLLYFGEQFYRSYTFLDACLPIWAKKEDTPLDTLLISCDPACHCNICRRPIYPLIAGFYRTMGAIYCPYCGDQSDTISTLNLVCRPRQAPTSIPEEQTKNNPEEKDEEKKDDEDEDFLLNGDPVAKRIKF